MTNKTEKIGVLGAGTMGAGIAQVAAQAGFETQLYDISQEFIDNGLGRIRSFLKGSRERGKITAEVEKEILDRLRSTTKLEDFRGYSLIIEAAPEKLDLKQSIFKQLDSLCGSETLIATAHTADDAAETILATGGLGQIFLHTTNPPGARGDGLVPHAEQTFSTTIRQCQRAYCSPLGCLVGGAPRPRWPWPRCCC